MRPSIQVLVLLAALGAVVAAPAGAEPSCPTLAPQPVPSPADAARALSTLGFVRSPSDGRAPLEVRMLWWTYPVPDPVSFEIDIDGVPTTGSGGPHRHIFAQPGRHTVTGRVIDRTGRTVATTLSVEVRPAAAFDAEVSACWVALKAAVARGDIAQALECVTSHTRNSARAALTAGRPLAADIPRYADTLTFLRKAGSIDLEYHTDFVNGRALTVIVSPDADDVWRFDAGGWH